jgi:hypothetical protein
MQKHLFITFISDSIIQCKDWTGSKDGRLIVSKAQRNVHNIDTIIFLVLCSQFKGIPNSR